MARFDVYRYRDRDGLVLDCQSNLLSDLSTRFVVPLMPRDAAPIPARRLNPALVIDGRDWVMVTQFAAAIPVRKLGPLLMSLASEDMAITNAVDMLVSGY